LFIGVRTAPWTRASDINYIWPLDPVRDIAGVLRINNHISVLLGSSRDWGLWNLFQAELAAHRNELTNSLAAT
jgi:hypothetical protein